jgi:hypothetical protein
MLHFAAQQGYVVHNDSYFKFFYQMGWSKSQEGTLKLNAG